MSDSSTSFEPFLPIPTPGDEDSPPTESTSSAPEATPSPPASSSPPSNPSTADSQPPEKSPAAPLPGDSSSSSAPPSDSVFPPPSPPLNSSTPPDSPPSSSSSPPAPSISSPIKQSPPADPPTSQQNSPSHSPPTIAVPTPPISPPPSGSHEPLPPAQQTSPPSRETPPGDHPSPPATPGSSLGTPTIDPTTPTQTPPSAPLKSTSAASHQTPQFSPPPRSRSESSNQKSSRSTSHSSRGSDSEAITGAVLAVGVFIAFAVLLVVCVRKRKKWAKSYASNYRPPAGTYSVKSDGYYYRQAGIGGSTQPDSQYGSIPSMVGNSIGSQRGHAFESGAIGYSKSSFAYEELMEITDGFSQGNVLGEGGFGCVYKGRLKDGREVAVKQLKTGSGQGEREFRAEVEIISRVHHRHLVSLVGYCISENQRLLVYEFVANNNLEHHLHGQGGLPVLDWYKRLKIAIGAAKGLAYLHEDCHPRIIHRDIKSANILLDHSFEAQVADFGLAKLTNDTSTHVSTRVMGTFGYMAPEYASSGKLTDRSDVYSFGVVLLELVTGRKPVDMSQPLGEESLVEWARPVLMRALESGDCGELVDPRLENNYVRSEMFRMIETAAACVRYSAPKRPRMVQVVRALDCEGGMPDLTGGVKFGQSTIFQSGQNAADLQKFRQMAFGSDEFTSEYSGTSGEYERRSPSYSGEYDQRAPPHSGEYQNHTGGPSYRSLNNWNGGDHTSGEYTSSNESETHAMSRRGSERSQGEAHVGYGSRWLRGT